ncbi:MFS transporter [Rhizobium binxianense]
MTMKRHRHKSNYALFLVVSSGLVSVARAMTLSFLAVKLQHSSELGPAMIGFLLGVGPLIGAIVSPFAGSMSDRLGRTTVLTFALTVMAFAMIAMGLAATVLAFCLAQIAAAVAISIYTPISRALLSDVCPEPTRLKYFSWRYTASNIGWAIGPVIGIAAGATANVLFMIAGTIYAALALALQVLQVPPVERCRNDVRPVGALTLLRSIRIVVRDRRLFFFICGGTLLIAVYGQWSATLAPYLAQCIPGGVEIFAHLVSINGAVVVIGNPIARRFIERSGAQKALLTGCILLILSQISFLGFTGFPGLATSMVVFTIGEILVVPSEYMLIDGISNDQNRGSYFGAHALSGVGNFIGPALGGAVLGGFGGLAMFTLFAVFAGLSALFFAIGGRTQPLKTA